MQLYTSVTRHEIHQIQMIQDGDIGTRFEEMENCFSRKSKCGSMYLQQKAMDIYMNK